jgi:hypothetical protein
MNKQSQWLFEAGFPSSTDSFHTDTNQKYEHQWLFEAPFTLETVPARNNIYVRTLESPELELDVPSPDPKSQQSALRKTFASSVITYKNSTEQCRLTNCSIYVPSMLRNQPKIDLLVFFHGLDTCKPSYGSDPKRAIQNFRLDDQVNKAVRQTALAVPFVFWNKEDRRQGIIRAAWSAAYLNAFVEEVLDEIGKSSRVRPSLGRLILAGHSAAYDILTPLADQFDCRGPNQLFDRGVPETNRGALAKLSKVLAMDTTYRTQDAKALERWALNRRFIRFILVLSKVGDPPNVWKNWENTSGKVALPGNLEVLKTKDQHCDLPGKYIEAFL